MPPIPDEVSFTVVEGWRIRDIDAALAGAGLASAGAYTDATRAACERHAPGRILFRPLGRIVVKGRTEPVPIHEVFGEAGSLPAGGAECVAALTRGLESYQARDWEGARRGFEASAVVEPKVPGRTPGVKNNPSLVFLSLVERFAREAPPADWDGTHVMTEK